MSDTIVCQIPGNIMLNTEGHYKLMTLIYTYGPERIATLLEKSAVAMQLNAGVTEYDFPSFKASTPEAFYETEEQSTDVSQVNEVEEILQLQNLSEAFRDLKVTAIINLEFE